MNMLDQSVAPLVCTGRRRAASAGTGGAAAAAVAVSLQQMGLTSSLAAWLLPVSSRQQQQFRHGSHLSYEEVSAGSPTSEHPTARPGRTLLLLHGLLGSGRNWRTWARRLLEAAAASHPPQGGPWRALLVDLRCHGSSARRPGLHPPHNMHSAAQDVARLIREQLGSHAPGAVLGHSMGGKVAMALMEQAAAAASQSAMAAEWCAPPRQLWVLDSQPGLVTAEQDAGTGVSLVLHTVDSVPLPIPSRAWLLSHLRAGGLSEALTTWLASNLVPQHPHQQQQQHPPASGESHLHHAASQQQPPYGATQQPLHSHDSTHHHVPAAPTQQPQLPGAGAPLTWSFEVQGAGAMYMSYRSTEYWHLLERPPHGTVVHLVQGDRSDRWPAAMEQRLKKAAAVAAASATAAAAADHPSSPASATTGAGRFEHHVLPKAGHWLHVDNPEGLMRLVLPRLAGL